MMAYQQRVNQFRSRIDFDDPSTTKPQSLAKSAVLQALEEEEREQSRAGKGWQRPSRSRQRDAPAAPRTRTPCIDRETVMRINRRPLRHRSCDNFWPPARTPSPLDRTGGPSVGETEGGSFAYEGARRYGSHESVYFDERVRKQHKIDPLRTKFDKANVVLVDWGRKCAAGKGPSDNGAFDKQSWEKVDDIANNSIKRGENIESERRPSQLTATPDKGQTETTDEGAVFGCERDHNSNVQSKPPSPPPRRYFLPIEQLQSGVGVEILLRCYKVSPNPEEEVQKNPIQSKIDNYPDSHQQTTRHQPFHSTPTAAAPSSDGDGILYRDGIQSKPPLKTRSTPTKRTNLSSKPPTPVHFSVNHNDTHNSDNAGWPEQRDEFNINSDTILNLNIDTGSNPMPPMPPQITVTGCRDQTTNTTTNHFDKRHPEQQQHHQTVPPKTNDQLLNEIIDENHNYNEKLITNSGRSDAGSHPTAAASSFDRQCLFGELPNEQHSKLNVSNQPNRNWINLNSNEIYPHAGGSGSSSFTSQAPLRDRPAGEWRDSSTVATAGARMTQTRVRCDSFAASTSGVSRPPEETNDGHRAMATAGHVDTGASNSSHDVHNNYDNKSVKSNYWDPMRTTTASDEPSSSSKDQQRLQRSESRDSARSWRVDEVLEFPPPPPYLCLCENERVPSGRCSTERSASSVEDFDGGAQICDNRNPPPPSTSSAQQQRNTPCKADNPTISQSCRQDSTSTVPSPSSTAAADVCPTFQRWRWDDKRAAATGTMRCSDDYFKTNLTDDKFLSENVNIACNSSDGQQQHQLRSKRRDDTMVGVDPRGTNDNLMVNRFDRAPSGVQNFDPLHKSIDAFLAAERQSSPKRSSSSATTGDPAPCSSPAPPPPSESKNSTRYISFTDGEYIFGPYDARMEEFQRFDLWGGDFHKRQNCCCHHRPCKKRSPSSGTSDGSSSTASTLCLECHYCQQRGSSGASSETLKEVDGLAEESETSQSPRRQKANQVENYDDTPRNVPAGNEPPQRPTSISYGRWVRFENGNISPPPSPSASGHHHRSPTPRVPTPYPSPTREDDDGEDENHHQAIFDQFAAAIEHQPQSKPDLVENVPLIDAVLDDLLTFSKTLVLRHSPTTSCAKDFPLAAVREEAKIVEINDDNLINLLADDDDNSGTKVVGETQSRRHSLLGGANGALGKKSLPSKQDDIEDDTSSSSAKRQENSGNESFREEKCALNTNEKPEQLDPKSNSSVDDSKDVIDNYLSTRRNQEDIFANVAIFNWNPLDVYHQHGLFMIDPRFALADLHATIPDSTTHGQDDSYNERAAKTFNGSRKRNDAHLNSPKRESASNDRHPPTVVEAAAGVQVADDDTGGRAETGIGIAEITDGADPSSVDVNSFATQLAAALGGDTASGNDDNGDDDGGRLLESHKIPNDRASPVATMDHFYDSAHVEYPVRADLCTIIQECHQSPKESDYDNDLAKNTTSSRTSSRRGSLQRPESSGRGETEGLKRVAWPPPAEVGDDYQHQQPAQHQQQQPYHYTPQQQQQPAQQQPHQFYPQQQQQQQQQNYQQPHTQQNQPRERIIPIQRPEPSPQQPQYQPQPTQAFQPLVSQQQQQQSYQQPEAIPQHYQQQQQQQQPAAADSQLPFFTTLRKEAPMSQEPTPVYHTEPVAAIYQGGTNMRGDQKWPPVDVKKQSELENEERRKLAQQPAFRPRKVQKDYSDFFAKNALNATYPGYRAPPGTQHHS